MNWLKLKWWWGTRVWCTRIWGGAWSSWSGSKWSPCLMIHISRVMVIWPCGKSVHFCFKWYVVNNFFSNQTLTFLEVFHLHSYSFPQKIIAIFLCPRSFEMISHWDQHISGQTILFIFLIYVGSWFSKWSVFLCILGLMVLKLHRQCLSVHSRFEHLTVISLDTRFLVKTYFTTELKPVQVSHTHVPVWTTAQVQRIVFQFFLGHLYR